MDPEKFKYELINTDIYIYVKAKKTEVVSVHSIKAYRGLEL